MAKSQAQIKADIAKLTKRIRDKNYRFQKLTDAQKRVRIAKDVIQNIEAGKLIAANHGYINLPGVMEDVFEANEAKDNYEYQLESPYLSERRAAEKGIEESEKIRETPLHVIFDNAPNCTVCAIGGIFVSAVLRTDGLKVKDLNDGGDSDAMREYLNDYFDMKQLGLIESAFECSMHFAIDQDASYIKARQAATFGQNIDSPEDRMLAIMNNIVENEGTFKP